MRICRATAILALAGAAACDDLATGPLTPPDEPRRSTTLTWSGYTWNVKSGSSLYPGPNNWSSNNVWVDLNGYLHLKISNVNGTWYAAELGTQDSLGFGTYQWWVEGRIDLLDPNVVLGLFQYNGPDYLNEIDIEFSRWGATSGYNSSYSVYPSDTTGNIRVRTEPFTLELEGTFTTQRYKWQSTSVYFQTLGGHRDNNVNQITDFNFAPTTDATKKVPQDPMPARMNLWLMSGLPPTNSQEVELVIRKFTYTPL